MVRARDVATVASSLARNRTVFVIGAAGIGKTTFAARAANRFTHVVGQSLQPFAASTYRPLEHALRVDFSGSPSAVASDVVGALDGRLLWVEDLHWADPGTIAVLDELVGRVPLLLTSRSAVALADRHDVETFAMQPLRHTEATALARRLHPDLSDAEQERLISAAGGSPLLISTLATGHQVTSTLSEAVAARVREIPPSLTEPLARLALHGCPCAPLIVGLDADEGVSSLVDFEDGLVWFHHELFVSAVLALFGEAQLRHLRHDLVERVDDADAARHLQALGEHEEAARRAVIAARGCSPSRRADLLLLAVTESGDGCPTRTRLDAAESLVASHRADDARFVLANLHTDSALESAEAGLSRARAAWLDGDATTALRELLVARELVGESDLALAARIAVERAAISVRTRVGDPELATIAAQALEIADRAGVCRATARNVVGLSLSHSGQPGWAAQFAAAAEIARAEGDVDEECASAYWHVSALGFYGPMDEAVRLGATMLERSRALGLRRWNLLFLSARSVHLCASGRHADSDLAAARVLLAQEPAFRNRAQVEVTLIAGCADRLQFSAAEQILERGRAAARSKEDLALLTCAEVDLAGARGDEARVRRAVANLVELGAGFFGLNAVAESAALHGLLHASDDAPVPSLGSALTPVLDVVRLEREGYDAWRAGNAKGAIAAFVAAATEWDRRTLHRFGHRAWATSVELALRSGDLDRAERLLDETDSLPPIEGTAAPARLAALRALLNSARIERLLTPREVEVLRLVRAGMSSEAIAQQLGISTATVDSHVNAAMRKLNCRTRRQAAALLTGSRA